MNKKVVFFNGPPRSGKDLAVTSLMDCYDNVEHIKFSAPLKTALPVFFGLSPSQAVRLEQTKDTKTDDLLGMSFREAQISLSENWFEAPTLYFTCDRLLISKCCQLDIRCFFSFRKTFFN